MTGDSERPRRWSLQRAGLIRDSGQRRRSPAGRKAIVWITTETSDRRQRCNSAAGLLNPSPKTGSNSQPKVDAMTQERPKKRQPNRYRIGWHNDPIGDAVHRTNAAMPKALPLELRNDALARGVLKLRRARRGGQSGSAGTAVAA